MAEARDIRHDLKLLASELRRLETEYTRYFSGRLPRPPLATRRRVETLIKHWDREHIEASVDRFRFQSLQSRFASFSDLWDRAMRAREEGRPGPLAPVTSPSLPDPERPHAGAREDSVICEITIADPGRDAEAVRRLHRSLSEARQRVGEEAVPYTHFERLVAGQVVRSRRQGGGGVRFSVALRSGQVSFTATRVRE